MGSEERVVRRFRAEDEGFVAGLRRQCFSASINFDLWLAHGHVLERAGQPVAAMLARPAGQWFGGRPVPGVAISSVMVDLAHRSAGVMGYLLESVLADHARSGAAVAALVPTALAPYRRAGFEVGGHRYRFVAPPAALRTGSEIDSVRWFETADVDALAEVYEEFARRSNGLIVRSAGWWQGHILPSVRSGDAFAVVAVRDGAVTGYAMWDQPSAPRGELTFRHRVRAREIVWTSRSSANALLRALARAGSPGEDLTWFGSPCDGLSMFFDVPPTVDWAYPWMLRIIDYPAALTARGYPPDVTVELVLAVRRTAPGRALRLTVSDGRCRAEWTTEAPEAAVTERGFAALYTGRLSAAEAQVLGELHTERAGTLDRIGTVFACGTPWMFDHF